jgi:hypothetical protein
MGALCYGSCTKLPEAVNFPSSRGLCSCYDQVRDEDADCEISLYLFRTASFIMRR